MLLRKLVVIGLVGFASLATSMALADEATAPGSTYVGASGVSFSDGADPQTANQLNLTVSSGDNVRFANMSLLTPSDAIDDRSRQYEVSVVARAANNVDVSFAHRGGVGFDNSGEISRQSRGSEVRVGRGLRMSSHPEQRSRNPRWYLFAASDQQALIWRPGSRNSFGETTGSGFALQDRVEIGDVQAGVTYEVYGVQTSLAYIERHVNTRIGGQSYRQEDDFVGLTLTMRH